MSFFLAGAFTDGLIQQDRNAPPAKRGQSSAGGKGKKRRQGTVCDLDLEDGLLLNFAEDRDALEDAGKVLKQKMARQKRKPRRLANVDPAQSMLPRSGQVRFEFHP